MHLSERLGWVLLIGEEHEQARVLLAILASVFFLALHFSFQPLKRYAYVSVQAVVRSFPI